MSEEHRNSTMFKFGYYVSYFVAAASTTIMAAILILFLLWVAKCMFKVVFHV